MKLKTKMTLAATAVGALALLGMAPAAQAATPVSHGAPSESVCSYTAVGYLLSSPYDCFQVSALTGGASANLAVPALATIYNNSSTAVTYKDSSNLDINIDLAGLHIDVDFQDGFRTFTTNPVTFPPAG